MMSVEAREKFLAENFSETRKVFKNFGNSNGHLTSQVEKRIRAGISKIAGLGVSDVDQEAVFKDVRSAFLNKTFNFDTSDSTTIRILILSRIVADKDVSDELVEKFYKCLSIQKQISNGEFFQTFVDFWREEYGITLPGFQWRNRGFPQHMISESIPTDKLDYIERIRKRRQQEADIRDRQEAKRHRVSNYDYENNPFIRRRTTPGGFPGFLRRAKEPQRVQSETNDGSSER